MTRVSSSLNENHLEIAITLRTYIFYWSEGVKRVKLISPTFHNKGMSFVVVFLWAVVFAKLIIILTRRLIPYPDEMVMDPDRIKGELKCFALVRRESDQP
jgi:hypothetical protein